MGIEYIMALITLAAVVVSFISVQAVKAQTSASVKTAEKQIAASVEIAEKQIKAQLVSANRQKWIDALRNQIVNLLSASDDLALSAFKGQETSERINSLGRARDTVSLHLNPDDGLHETLSTALTDFLRWSTQCTIDVSQDKKTPTEAFNAKTFAANRKLVQDAAQAVLSAESERVKRGE